MFRALALAAVLLVVPAFPAGCAVDQQAIRKDSDEQADLTRRAELYWRSVRWGDTATAASFVSGGDRRLRYQQKLDDEQKNARLSDSEVQRVELHNPPSHPETTADGTRVLRRATVIVRTEGYRLPAQVVEQRTVSQEWYRSPDGWFIEWDGD